MLYSLIRPLLFKLDAEQAHSLIFGILKKNLPEIYWDFYCSTLTKAPITVSGLHFKNPIGLAAGLDKNGDYIRVLSGLGFGFIELGTVTPKPQPGNPRPRLFRVKEAQALINRMGFNNLGVDYLVNHLRTQSPRPHEVIIGANIGKNKDTPLELAAEDYCFSFKKVYPYVDYVTANISSPNTPGLRQLQSDYYLQDLLTQLMIAREELSVQYHRKIPIWIKISPDLSHQELKSIAGILLTYQVDAVIATNTTLDHSKVSQFAFGKEEGGVSGLPLLDQSTMVISELNQLLQDKIPIIAVGGIMNPQQAINKFAAGAKLIQLYSGLIYQGPSLIRKILKELTVSKKTFR